MCSRVRWCCAPRRVSSRCAPACAPVFPAGIQDAHQLINRGDRPALYLEVSNRDPADGASYPDPDVDLVWNPPHAPGKFTRRDGTPYT